MKLQTLTSLGLAFVSVIAVAGDRVRAQGETLTATAAIKQADAGGSSLTVAVRHFATDAERNELMAATKKGGTAAARTLLAKRADAGTVQLGGRQTPIKYAYSRATGGGRLVTIVTAEPIAATSPGKDAGSVGLVLLVLDSSGGHGELLKETQVRVDDQGAIVTDGHAETVALSDVVAK